MLVTTTANLGRAVTERRDHITALMLQQTRESSSCSHLLSFQFCPPLHRLTVGFSILVRPEEQVLCGEHLNEVGRGKGCQTKLNLQKPHWSLKVGQPAVDKLSGRWSS